ncbi:glycosyltransferase [Janthinobacterium agaricidamnosum]|uniref:Glycosyltransferase sugar-binding region containing DXD motif family protein n=1 Tax=Janthinobacterium agaricidamnosum NBRC 102515 = DSM 9628 TaxID=1349767 RepID=W0UX08_9BURK|nr:glycosyltransferase [Janthinobacterium agaricidamnosum]CDG81014.1 putative uncharacterized protein [Janthinobacterium agaricidamnosum NBRC 102515 = DSM 9628]
MSYFDLEYEVLIRNLKSDFLVCKQLEWQGDTRLRAARDIYNKHLRRLQKFVRSNFSRFDAGNISSLLGIPARPLAPDEKVIQRIWMGGPPPSIALEAIKLWDGAIDEVSAIHDVRYESILWVWDARQLQGDALFVASLDSTPPCCTIGAYAAGRHLHAVRSLRALASGLCPEILGLLDELHAKKYYVNLADFFRLLVLRECGGLYLDADTMPHKSATIFLSKPEVPDYMDLLPAQDGGAAQPCQLSWMNLYHDENGVLIAKKHDPAVAAMVGQMRRQLQAMALPAPDKKRDAGAARAYAALLHDATYGVWRQGMGRSFIACHDLAQSYSVLHDQKKDIIISGLHGMRLVVDAFTNAAVPLNPQERHSYDKCMAALDRLDWKLEHIHDLERIADVCFSEEVPRMAYAPQLRAEPASCHYYSFLSHDEKLDRINALFGAYLVSKNAERIRRGNFWSKTKGRERQRHLHPQLGGRSGARAYDPS